MNRAPSLRALLAAFPSVDPDKLKLIRKVWRELHRKAVKQLAEQHAPKAFAWSRECFNPPSTRSIRWHAIDELLDTHGIEHLGTHRRTCEHVDYCNAGDAYAATLIFHGNRMYIGCWGDLVERNQIKEVESL